jgi:hypothetical protein
MAISSFRRLTLSRRLSYLALVTFAIMTFAAAFFRSCGQTHRKTGSTVGNLNPSQIVPFVHGANWTLADIQNRRQDPANRVVVVATHRLPPTLPPELPPSARNRTRKFSKLLVYNRNEAI